MDILLSFIIPVYNVERYIEECVYSIINQIKGNVEIILIDDGSTDQSGKICDIIARQHTEVQVIHNENRGPAYARNIGIKAAKGRYIAFVDSDDRIADNSIPFLLQWITENNKDICFLNAIKFYPDGSTESMNDDILQEEIEGKEKIEIIQYLSKRTKFSGSACTKIFNASFINENMIRFPYDRRMHEDLYFVLQSIYYANTCDALDMPYYEYRQNRSGSRSLSSIEKNYMDLKMFVEEKTEQLTHDKYPINEVSKYLMAFVAYEYTLLLWKYDLLGKTMKHKIKPFIRRYRWILKYNHTKRVQIIKGFLIILGISSTSKMMNYYMERRNRTHEDSSNYTSSSV